MTKRIIASVVTTLFLIMAGSCENANQKPSATVDREGTAITLPSVINTIVSLGAPNTEILAALGMGEKIIAIDTYSTDIDGISESVMKMDLLALDAERLIQLQPDVIFVSGMAKVDNQDPLKIVRDAGITVAYIPASSSIEGAKEDIRFLAAATGKQKKGDELIKEMEEAIDEISAIGATITDKKTVYFEISRAPYMYSFGTGVYLNEMIELIGAENVLKDQENWLPVSEETILAANPDVILTNDVDSKPVEEILSREGWDGMTAVKGGFVYYIDTNSSSRSTHNLTKALRQMAEAVYPEKY